MTQHAGRTIGSGSYARIRTAPDGVLQRAARLSPAALAFVSSIGLSSALCFAQGAAPTAVTGSQAAPLPLSGRSQGGTVTSAQNPIPGATASVVTLNPAIQIQGPYSGSVEGVARSPFSGNLSLREAVQRGLDYNLGAVGLLQAVRQARGQQKTARSALLPNIVGDLTGATEKVNLAALGITQVGGFQLPNTVLGPFSLVDLRAKLSQTVFDLTAWNNYHAATETAKASELTSDDSRDLVVLAVAGAYLQAVAARARVASGRAQIETANALLQQASERRAVGLVAQVDVNRAQVQALTEQQRLVSLQNDFAKQKINLARMTGLPPTDQYELVDEVPFTDAPAISVEEALRRAVDRRSDLKAAQAQVAAADRALSAARAERLPSVAVSADYGTIGPNLGDAQSTFTLVGTVRVPIWQGGRAAGHIDQAEAVVAQRRAEADDLRLQIEAEVRKTYLDLDAAAQQVAVARRNVEVSQQTLDLTRQRFDAGVADNVEVVQAQQSLATADLDYINSVFAHNVARLTLSRTIGRASENLTDFLK